MAHEAPELRGARLVGLGLTALLTAWLARAPAAVDSVRPVATAAGCELGLSGGAPCPCERLPERLRWALGLPLRLNEAAEPDLALLPGIGPVRAAEIARDRAERGRLGSVEELARVRGIGPRTVERLRELVVVGGPDPACGAY